MVTSHSAHNTEATANENKMVKIKVIRLSLFFIVFLSLRILTPRPHLTWGTWIVVLVSGKVFYELGYIGCIYIFITVNIAIAWISITTGIKKSIPAKVR